MKIITINTNGIRSAARKGFFDWFVQQDADILCIQETKAQFEQLQDDPQFSPKGYHHAFVSAEKKGYSGVAIYSKAPPQEIIRGCGIADVDAEGRYLEFVFANFSVASLYLHSGTSGEHRQAAKYQFMDQFYEQLMARKSSGKPLILCGDINIAHTEKDIKNAKGNQKNSGFLPEERVWLTTLFANGYCDAFRLVDDRAEQYSWWSNRGQAYANNVGWRIDYHIISNQLAGAVRSASIYKAEKFSDHAPVIIEYANEAFK